MTSDSALGAALVGRREELAFLHDEFTAVCDGQTRFVLIEGEAGIGKSRLVAEFLGAVGSEGSLALGHCSEHARSPYLPFVPLLPRLDLRGQKAVLFEAAARSFERESRRRPLIAVLEDLQWADAATVELLQYLLQHLAARVLFLITFRTENAARNPALSAFRHAAARNRAAVCALRGLRRNEIRRLVQHLVHTTDVAVSPETVSRIETLSEGNPLFAEELARIASESGALNLATHVPLSVQAILAERLAPLSEAERGLLIRAAIIGPRFDVGFLAKIAQVPLDDVYGVLQRAVNAGLILAVPETIDAFAFRHALIRQALADQLILGLAAPLHERIAEELQMLPGAHRRCAELAYHWSAARIPEKARFFNERAAEDACGLYAYRDGIGFYLEALRWDYPPGEARAALFERLGTLLYIDGTGEEPARWFERARDEHVARGNAAGAARALLLLADQHWVDGRTRESLAAAGTAAEMLAPLDAPALTADAQLSLARFAITLGEVPKANAHLSQAHLFESFFTLAMRASFHEIRAEYHAACGDVHRALADCEIASRLAQETGISELIAQIENNFALVAGDLGEIALASRRHEIALAEARRTSMTWRVAYSALNFAYTLLLAGELQRARALVWEALESGVTTATFRTKAATVGIPLAMLLNDRRLLQACDSEDALDYARRSHETQRIGSVDAAFAELREAQGSSREAYQLLGHALETIDQAHRCWNLFAITARCADGSVRSSARELLRRSGGRAHVRRAYQLLYDRPLAAAQAFERMGCRLYHAYALEAGGRTADALALYRLMGDVRDIERLRIVGAPSSPSMPLSARQMEVARLVAVGSTNKTIAQQLHISEHTVEHHLSEIFARLGIHTRSALAARVAAAR